MAYLTREKIAEMLNGRKYSKEITDAECKLIANENFVVIFGASDDLMEFRGAIDDEIGCYEGGKVYLDNGGLLENECENEYCPHFIRLKKQAKKIVAIWNSEGYSWIYKTDIPHAIFEIIDTDFKPNEPEHYYCRGIVIDLSELE